MAYDYIKRAYGLDFKVGQRVMHTEMKGTEGHGTVARENKGASHYVMVRFDNKGPRALPCHPQALRSMD